MGLFAVSLLRLCSIQYLVCCLIRDLVIRIASSVLMDLQEIEADKEGWYVHLYGGISFYLIELLQLFGALGNH